MRPRTHEPIPRRQPLARSKKRIRSVSTKRAAQLREYSRLRAAFLNERRVCGVWIAENGWEWVGVGRGLGHYANRDRTRLVTAPVLFEEGAPMAVEVHHMAGRTGWRLNNVKEFLPVSREAHIWIHAFPSAARENGFLK